MFGKKLSEYIQFEKGILILIALAFAIRLAVSLAGTSFSTTRWISINLVLLAGLIYCAVGVQIKGFGGYKHLFGLLLVQTVFAHLLIALGIILGIVTGTTNAFTVPEVFGGNNGANWFHVLAHAVGGFILPVFSWLVGSVILFVTRMVSPGKNR